MQSVSIKNKFVSFLSLLLCSIFLSRSLRKLFEPNEGFHSEKKVYSVVGASSVLVGFHPS